MQYLRRDEDSPAMTRPRLLRRAAGEMYGDVRTVLREWDLRDGLALAGAMVRYHTALALGRNGRGRIRTSTVRGAGRSVRYHYRTDLSDLFVLRETFVQQIYRFPYESHIGPVSRVLDLGSNIGLSSLYFAHLFPTAGIACVEPVDGNAELVERNRDANGFDWPVTRAAVAAEAGEATLWATEWWASSSTTPEVVRRRQENANRPEGSLGATTSTVPAVTVDMLLDELGWDRVDVLKMDVEGAEHDILVNGDTSWLDRTRILVLDIHAKYVDRDRILEVLAAHGFSAAAESGPHSAVFLSPSARRLEAAGSTGGGRA